MAQETSDGRPEDSSPTDQKATSSVSGLFAHSHRRGTSGIGGVMLLLFAIIGLAGSTVGYKLASDAGFGVIASTILGVVAFVTTIVGILFLLLTFIFLVEYLAVGIGFMIYTAINHVSKRVFSERTRTILTYASLVIVIPVVLVLMLNALMMGIPSLFLAVYVAEEVFKWGTSVGLGTTVSTAASVVTGIIILVGALSPITMMEK